MLYYLDWFHRMNGYFCHVENFVFLLNTRSSVGNNIFMIFQILEYSGQVGVTFLDLVLMNTVCLVIALEFMVNLITSSLIQKVTCHRLFYYWASIRSDECLIHFGYVQRHATDCRSVVRQCIKSIFSSDMN